METDECISIFGLLLFIGMMLLLMWKPAFQEAPCWQEPLSHADVNSEMQARELMMHLEME